MFRAAGLVRSAAGRARASVQRNLNGGDRQIGDYPTNIPFESNQTRDPFKYWDKQTRRDFGEPVRLLVSFRFLFVCFAHGSLLFYLSLRSFTNKTRSCPSGRMTLTTISPSGRPSGC